MNGHNNYRCGAGFVVWIGVFSGKPNYDGRISLQGDTATTTAKFKNRNRRNVGVLIRVKMYKSYQYQPLSSICSGE